MSLLSKLFQFVLLMTKKYNIDESHGLSHSMNVLNYVDNIYESELPKNPILSNQKTTIYVSAILHDMCDKKYVDEITGMKDIYDFLSGEITELDSKIALDIISTMSYSKVKKVGFPELKEHQLAYHIVREADLLTAYDFDRCMIYNIHKKNGSIIDAFNEAVILFDNRVFKHNEDNLFVTNYSKTHSLILHSIAHERINVWKRILSRGKP